MNDELMQQQASRLAKLQQECSELRPFRSTSITAPDLLLLLQHDPTTRSLIAQIAQSAPAAAPGAAAAPAPAEPVMQAARHEAPVSVHGGLAEPLALLAILERNPALRSELLGALDGPEGLLLMALAARAGNWDRIESLWDSVAQCCKQQERAADADELALLAGCIGIHNLIWAGRQALLLKAEQGAAFDFNVHERGDGTGASVAAVRLPGLKNAAGVLRKKILVSTR